MCFQLLHCLEKVQRHRIFILPFINIFLRKRNTSSKILKIQQILESLTTSF